MLEAIKSVAQMGIQLTQEEQHLLTESYTKEYEALLRSLKYVNNDNK